MNGVNLGELFDTFEFTAFRLERHQVYSVAEEVDRFRAFQEGLPRPERSVRTNEYLRQVARAALAGKQWSRVRVVEFPLTTYTRYELESYIESQAAGERVHLISEDEFARLRPGWDQDFWLFDGGQDTVEAVLLRYTPEGAFTGLEPVTDQDSIRELELIAFDLAPHTTPLNEFLARLRPGGV